MRRAVLVASVLCLSALAVPHAAAGSPCMDGFDNDGDGTVDWPQDTGCSGPGDPDERPCAMDRPDECVAELQPCPDMLPPTGLHATWTDHGIGLEWTEPLSGAPPVYLVFRVPVSFGPPVRAEVTVAAPDQLSPAAVQSPVGLPHGLLPVDVTIQVPGRGGVTVVAQLPLDAAASLPEPIASVPGAQASYFDASAEPASSYAYWVEGAGPGCRGPASNAAYVSAELSFPPGIPHTQDCFYYEPPSDVSGPSTRCLDAP